MRKYLLFSLFNSSHLPCSQRGKQIRWDSGIRQMLKSSSTNDHVEAGDLNIRWQKYCITILLLATMRHYPSAAIVQDFHLAHTKGPTILIQITTTNICNKMPFLTTLAALHFTPVIRLVGDSVARSF